MCEHFQCFHRQSPKLIWHAIPINVVHLSDLWDISLTTAQDLFIAGTDTTSTALEWEMTGLVRHPEVVKKAQKEIRRLAWTKDRVEETDLDQFRYPKLVGGPSLPPTNSTANPRGHSRSLHTLWLRHPGRDAGACEYFSH